MRALRALLLATVAAIATSTSVAFALPIVSIQSASTDVMPGDTFSLDVRISDATDLHAFDFAVTFDPVVLAASSSPSPGSFLASGGGVPFLFPGTIDNTAGAIGLTSVTLLSFVAGVSGSGTLASLSFTALTAGTSPIHLENVRLVDSPPSRRLAFSTQDGAVNVGVVNVIPEPHSVILFACGGVLITMSLRRRSLH